MKARINRALSWSHRAAWERVFRRLLHDKINDAVIAGVRRSISYRFPDEYFHWLNVMVADVTNQALEDLPALLAKRLSDYYAFVVAFHGTRAASAMDFLDHGIRLSDIHALNLYASELFGESDALDSAIAELRQCEQHDHGKVFLALTKDACLRDHPHYMERGSEQLGAIAIRLGQLAKLEAMGKPLIVECLIPTACLESESKFWRGRAFSMLEDYFKRLLRPSERRRVEPSCVIVTQPLPAGNVLRVHEFTEVKRSYRQPNFYTGVTDEWVETVFRPFKIWRGRTQLRVPA